MPGRRSNVIYVRVMRGLSFRRLVDCYRGLIVQQAFGVSATRRNPAEETRSTNNKLPNAVRISHLNAKLSSSEDNTTRASLMLLSLSRIAS